MSKPRMKKAEVRRLLIAEVISNGGWYGTFRAPCQIPWLNKCEQELTPDLIQQLRRANEALVQSPTGIATAFRPFAINEFVFLAEAVDILDLIDKSFYERYTEVCESTRTRPDDTIAQSDPKEMRK